LTRVSRHDDGETGADDDGDLDGADRRGPFAATATALASAPRFPSRASPLAHGVHTTAASPPVPLPLANLPSDPRRHV